MAGEWMKERKKEKARQAQQGKKKTSAKVITEMSLLNKQTKKDSKDNMAEGKDLLNIYYVFSSMLGIFTYYPTSW